MSLPPDVVFVVLDTLRRDRVSCYGYERETTPNFDAFAAASTLFTDAVSQSPWSVPSHASMFTGAYPTDHGATTLRPIFAAEDTLPARLARAGYETYAASANWYVRPMTGFGGGFDEFHTLSTLTVPDGVSSALRPLVHAVTASRLRRPFERVFNASRERTPERTGFEGHTDDGLLDAVEGVLDRADSPFFLFVNLLDCHLPRTPRRDHAETFVDDELHDLPVVANERAHIVRRQPMTDNERRKASQLYDADVRTTDERFGELLTLLDGFEGLVVTVSDHGEHLGEFGLLGHQFSVFDPVVSVPLAIRFPDRGPAVVDEQVETRRLFETVLDETGVASYPERSLASGAGDDTARGQFVSPMVDIERYLFDGEFEHDPSLLGETLSFERRGDEKLISFGDEQWLFELPESEPDAAQKTTGSDQLPVVHREA